MPNRQLVVLGTASQVPTRTRNQNGYLLRWDDQLVLFDPGEGTQRQLTLAGVSPARITAICITHAHGDHCLGLPGILQRMSLERVQRRVPVIFPRAAEPFIDRLRHATVFDDRLAVDLRPVDGDGPVLTLGDADHRPTLGEADHRPTLCAAALDHRIPAVGYRLVEPDGRRMLPDRLTAAGVTGPDVGRLQRAGVLQTTAGRIVRLEEVSAPRPGQRFGFVMDTRLCPGAEQLAAGADLLVIESTFSHADAELAGAYGHLTARQAAELAVRAGARRLVLTHFSQRYPDLSVLLDEARAVHDDVWLATDLGRIDLPARS